MINPQLLDLSSLPCVELSDRNTLPEVAAIYFAIDSEENIQYIGQTANLNRRWKSNTHHKLTHLEKLGGTRISYMVVEVGLLMEIETALIEWFEPPLNNLDLKLNIRKPRPIKGRKSDGSFIEWRMAVVMAERGLRNKDVIKASGLTAATVSKFKNRRVMPKRLEDETLDKLCAALDCEPGDLMRRQKESDRQCNKAWGINNRPKLEFDENDPDDTAWLSDGDLLEAPSNPGTYEGGQGKPTNGAFNKWCARECERSVFVKPGEPIELPDFSQLVYNQPWKHEGES